MTDIRRFDIDSDGCKDYCTDGEFIAYDDVAPLLEKAKALNAKVEYLRAENAELKDELAALRTRVLEWVTVTEDPATLPEIGRAVITLYGDIIINGEVDDSDGRRLIYVREYSTGDWYDLCPGDRWAYIPEAQP